MSDPRPDLAPYRLPPTRERVQDLHGPRDADGPCWLRPTLATERWEHGQLVEVTSEARRADLRRWGPDRVAEARIGPITHAPLTDAERVEGGGWPGTLRRAFDHVGCKAAHLVTISDDSLRPYGAIGEALLATRGRPRGPALARLLDAYGGDTTRLHADLDAVDLALDDAHQDTPRIFDVVPEHCRRLSPLRNLMRLAERQGVLFRPMSFTAYEAENSFVPDLPIACLDEAIYGGGFDHDLFHQLLPVPPPDDPFHFEASLLVVESAAQAYNSLVLASRYSGPAYEGHATWPGAPLFDRLSDAFGCRTVPELVGGYALLGLVCHPELDADRVATWSTLMPPTCQAEALAALVDEHARYVRLDAGWLQTLRPRYEAPVMQRWRGPLTDRTAASHGAVLEALHDLLWALEDVDLRTHDFALVGSASTNRQRGRWAWMRALELTHLLDGHDVTPSPDLRNALGALSDLDVEQRRLVDAAVHLTRRRPAARDADETATLTALGEDLEAQVTRETARLDAIADALRAEQRAGRLGGPAIPSPFVDTYRELFAGAEYNLPVHVGADGPGAPA